MLETLRIQNYALIDEMEIDFREGFNVLTGETGAGKSIVVGALNLVLGARAERDAVRDGADRAKVDAVFRVRKPSPRLAALLKELDAGLDNDELLVSRLVTADGRSRAYVGGNLVPVSVLADIGDELVDMHGQHEHQSLIKPDRQLDLLDAVAKAEDEAAAVAEKVAELRKLDREIAELAADDREKARQIEFLKFELAEIDAAGLQPGEEDELRARRDIITNAEKIYALANGAYAALYEADGNAAIDGVDSALRALEDLAAIGGSFQPLVEQLRDARAAIEAVAGEIRVYTREVEFDPQELETLNSRLALLGSLKRKYGDSIEAILEYRDKAKAEIDRFELRDERLLQLQQAREALYAEAMGVAGRLSDRRKKAAKTLDKQVVASLQELGMKGAVFETRFERIELATRGLDRVEFYLAANPGEKPKPLRQVASGGEISRIMLALKVVSADADRIPTLIFDEIDAGVGGAVAVKVADKLRKLARSHQTLCITHLPQIAAAADSHYNVIKQTAKGRTTTRVTLVQDQTRVEEVARLLDGSLSEASLKHARALLEKSRV
jgi:DNA repair protein RecN (Recombination protein N)